MRQSKIVRAAICLLAVIGGALCLPALIVGGGFARDWVHLQTSTVLHFRYHYLLAGLLWVAASLVGIGAMLYSFTKRRFYALGALVAVAIGFWTAASLPDLNPRVEMMGKLTSLLGHADRSLAAWDEKYGRFPNSEAELLNALSPRPLSEPPLFRDGARDIPYAVKIVTNATGPYVASVPEQPGVFVYAVRQDLQEYWVTMTTLDRPVGGHVVFHRVAGDYRNGKLWVMNRTHRKDGQPQKGFIE